MVEEKLNEDPKVSTDNDSAKIEKVMSCEELILKSKRVFMDQGTKSDSINSHANLG